MVMQMLGGLLYYQQLNFYLYKSSILLKQGKEVLKMDGKVSVKYKKVKHTKAGKATWKRVLLMFLSFIVLAGIVVFAYDGAGQYEGWFEHPGGSDSYTSANLHPYEEEVGGYAYNYYIYEYGYHEDDENMPGYTPYAQPVYSEYYAGYISYDFPEIIHSNGYNGQSGYSGYAPGYIGIMPLNIAFASNIAELRQHIYDAPTNGNLKTIYITANIAITGLSGTAGNLNTFGDDSFRESRILQVANGRNILIMSDTEANAIFNLGQAVSSNRHFVVESGATLRLENINLQRSHTGDGGSVPGTASSNRSGGIWVSTGGTAILGNGAAIRGTQSMSIAAGPRGTVNARKVQEIKSTRTCRMNSIS